MSYTALAAIGVAAAAALDLVVLRTALLRTRSFWVAYVIMLFFQLVTNGILTGVPVVRYDAAGILGPRLVFAPVEDLLFGFAMIVVTLSVWCRLGARARLPAAPSPRPPRGG